MNKIIVVVTLFLLSNYCVTQKIAGQNKIIATGQNDVLPTGHNEILATGQKGKFTQNLTNFIYRNDDNVTIDYHGLILTMDTPEIEINNLSSENLLFDLISDIGTISIDGEMLLNGISSVTSINFNDVKVRGPVSLQRTNKSIIPLNADLDYNNSGIVVTIANEPPIHDFSIDILWFGIENSLTNILLEQAPERIGKILRHGQENAIVDKFLSVAKEMNPIDYLSGTEEIFKLGNYTARAITNVGTIKGMQTIKRYQNFTMIEDKERTLIYGYLTFPENYEYGYSNYTFYYNAVSSITNNVATITASKNKILVEMSFDHLNNCNGIFNSRFVEMEDITTNYSLADKQEIYNGRFDQWMLGQLRLRRTLVEDWISTAFNEVYWNDLFDIPMC